MLFCRVSRMCRARFILSRSEETAWNKTRFIANRIQGLHDFSRSSEVVFRRRPVASTKCWPDFLLLNASIGTGVIVGFSPLFDKFELTNIATHFVACSSY